ncbi:sulphatase-modifying factor protein : Uncharacterized protein OS=Candidatus Entotheonella sp. TSY1 GN=ETSY1_19825 PE=4 SV=1: FGE-sulfatase [Gemmata massiliana]|uniref:Sulfatase-modifying factor enzyme-like domain-containing protein n=1 Tax=Gemmata massiliana TaxID=1210884 RepID=A0A6P2CU80_9BACT|nr:sulphatase-modifying factor protein : Uncharacterized protein OS=Candidatus Entotheonella sp. TSY1 GN=ETSY1_19825 PE=4 SV=1: FGE-sulfatase [Gemmata massiliana]
MGSPNSEEGHRSNEGPIHEVVLSRGYWLFDTPCTQELRSAVMGKKPSRFTNPRCPVESVSWNDCHAFVAKLSGTVGLDLALPTEAEWEYACRAGSPGVQYGDLDAMAWYKENAENETHEVGQKRANGWGCTMC